MHLFSLFLSAMMCSFVLSFLLLYLALGALAAFGQGDFAIAYSLVRVTLTIGTITKPVEGHFFTAFLVAISLTIARQGLKLTNTLVAAGNPLLCGCALLMIKMNISGKKQHRCQSTRKRKQFSSVFRTACCCFFAGTFQSLFCFHNQFAR